MRSQGKKIVFSNFSFFCDSGFAMSTIRQQLIALLSQREYDARELSQALHIREKEVYEHLSHIARSAASQKQKLITVPSVCISCGYEFEDRRRFTKPSRCPRCKSERIREPAYRIV